VFCFLSSRQIDAWWGLLKKWCCLADNLSDSEFTILPTTFSICFHIRNNNKHQSINAEADFGINFGINETQKKIVVLLMANSKATLGQIAGDVGVSKRQVESSISDLKSKGLIDRVGVRKNGRWIVKSST